MVIAIVSLVTLFLSNRDQESITFREEIEGLSSKLDRMVVHVLSRPEKGWEGEKGRIDASVLSRGLTGVENNHRDAHRFPTRRGTRLRGADVLPVVQLRFFALDAQRSRLERTVSR
jgi:hypothetical protein